MEEYHQEVKDEPQQKGFVRPKGFFDEQTQDYLRQAFRQQMRHEEISISQQSLLQFKSLKFEDMECEVFIADPCIEKHLQTFLNKEHCQQILELNAQTMKIQSAEENIDFWKNCEEDYIKRLKQNDLYLSQEEVQLNQEYFLQLWQMLKVKPGQFTRLMRTSARTLLIYQVYFNQYCHWIKERGQWVEFQVMNKSNIEFLTDFFDEENQNLDRVVPLEKEHYIGKLLTLKYFPGHGFNITKESKSLHSKQKLKEPKLLKDIIAQVGLAQEKMYDQDKDQ